MPKSPSLSLSPSPKSTPDPTSRLSDIDLKKRKNASAQAAFRARRANYISTLESTVTTLESVVIQLQDSCRDIKAECDEMRQENARVKLQLREREHFWRSFWLSRKSENEDVQLPPVPEYLDSPASISHHPTTSHPPTPLQTYQTPSTSTYHHFSGVDGSPVEERAPYPYLSSPANRWSQASALNSNVATAYPSNSHSNSMYSMIESPVEMNCVPRYPDGQRAPANGLDAPYAFADINRSGSLSPALSTAPNSSSSSVASAYGYPGMRHDRPDYNYRVQPDVAVRGGTADISTLAGPGADAIRYRMATRNGYSERPNLPPLQTRREGSDPWSPADGTARNNGDFQTNQNSTRSPSPEAPQISGTLAVIKASAFGALRKARTKNKKGGNDAARAAMDVLEARGLGMSGMSRNDGPGTEKHELRYP